MAQQVKIAGALFNDVPYIQCPDVNDVYHPFVDPSVTTAAASDVAQGKQFIAADGTLTTGTASGGGTVTLKLGALRPDAELVQKWTYDKLIHTDEGVTIPSYSTTDTTLKASANLTPTVTLDYSSYDYIYVQRNLVTPTYSIATRGKGRQEYFLMCAVSEFVRISAGFDGVDPTSSSVTTSTMLGTVYRIVYWNGATDLRDGDNTYGAYVSVANPSISSGVLTAKTPTMKIKGNTAYLSQTYYNALTDIRYQYIGELYRTPKNSLNVEGYAYKSQVAHAIDCANSASGTLT